jgi:hypothetical protein
MAAPKLRRNKACVGLVVTIETVVSNEINTARESENDRMKKVTSRLAIAVLFSIALVGNLQAETAAKPKGNDATVSTKLPELSTALKDELFALFTSEEIVNQCGRRYKINEATAEVFSKQLEEVFRGQGFGPKNPANLDLALSRREFESRAVAYMRSRNMRVDGSSSWCPAGQAEIAQKTKIGKYLLKK